jgi:hypothetical protein
MLQLPRTGFAAAGPFWATLAQAKVYTDAADRKRLAAQGMPLIVLPRS